MHKAACGRLYYFIFTSRLPDPRAILLNRLLKSLLTQNHFAPVITVSH